MPTLVLLRHGQSQWNLENRFTGWWDVDLTDEGIEEAKAAGALLGADFLDHLLLVEAGQPAIVALVEVPVLVDR